MNSEIKINEIFKEDKCNYVFKDKFIDLLSNKLPKSQVQTNLAFKNKWETVSYKSQAYRNGMKNQKKWFLELYGFKNEEELKQYLQKFDFVLDAGSGKSGKIAWLAKLSPKTIFVAVEISDAILEAKQEFKHIENLFFIKGNIEKMNYFKKNIFDFVVCDQVLHHTNNPDNTLKELTRVSKKSKELALYVYSKKGLPRELLDDYFRNYSKELSHDQLMKLSTQLMELGRILDKNKQEINFPDIPLLNIKGGKMNVQRFIYWNFIKCFWNEDLGEQVSVMTNYDWYSPAQANRYSEKEFRQMLKKNSLGTVYFHKENACYSGRFFNKEFE